MDAAQVRRLFDDSAGIYDRAERVGSFGRGLPYRRQALARAGLSKGARVLDVACGTGLMSRAAWQLTEGAITLTGVDPSPGMIAHARRYLPMECREGVAESLPVAAAEADFLMMGYALRHVRDWARAFGEFARVLRPGGRLCLLEITRPEGRGGRAVFDFYFGLVVPLLGSVDTASAQAWRLYRYYWRTMMAARPPADVLDALKHAGFAEVAHTRYGGFLSEYTARRP
jgi:demethylmenaquinone methyltransferase/2-methoxy-6-polyprenyl-1,4-benzoquinol methylase